ncbi:hypothetical protein C8Q80DRAFT_1354782 [Daedaleopsis nitida]|nr:hypothetical protein C8Q80DRAFT_1354782 [Daedaleopsis nitida]
MSAPLDPHQLAVTADHLMAAKMFSLASCVMLFYDIAITFGDEVERIWKQRFTGATVLWFLNRYLSPLGYIVIIVSFHDPSWSKATCQHYILYPEILKIFTATAVGFIFILRLYSIYSKSTGVLYSFTGLLIFELAVKIWAFTDGVMLELPPGFVGCILTGKSSPGDRIIYTWVAELVFDSAVFFATLYRTIQLYRRTIIGEALSLITVIMRDGIMYFAAIFVSNLVTVLIFVVTQPDLKVINASFSTLITSLMVSRLMLNLRGEVLRRNYTIVSNRTSLAHDAYGDEPQLGSTFSSRVKSRTATTAWSAFEQSMIGNLGAPIITFEPENRNYNFEDDEDVIDPSLPPSPRSEHGPSYSPFSRNRSTSLRTPSPPHTPSTPVFAPIGVHIYPPPKAARRSSGSGSGSSADPAHHIASTSDHMSTHSVPTSLAESGIPVHADYAALRIRAVPHLHPSSPHPHTAQSFAPVRSHSSAGSYVHGKNQNQGPYRKKSTATPRRPRTSESLTSNSDRDRDGPRADRPALAAALLGLDRRRDPARDVAEMMQTRSMPAPLVVTVTEEVVVDGVVTSSPGPGRSPSTASPPPSATTTRRPWLAPQSWRDMRQSWSSERRGSSEG